MPRIWSVFNIIFCYVADPEEAIYDDVPRENSDSEPGLLLSGLAFRSFVDASITSVCVQSLGPVCVFSAFVFSVPVVYGVFEDCCARSLQLMHKEQRI